MYVCVLGSFACLVCAAKPVPAWCPWRFEEGCQIIRSPGTGVPGNCIGARN